MAPRPERISLRLTEKVGIVLIILASIYRSLVALFTGVFTSRHHRPPSYFRHVMYTAMRTAGGQVTTNQEQWAYVDTTKTYLNWCKLKKVEPSTETLSDGTKAHWIGSKDASGGFNATARPEYFDFLSSVIESLNQHSNPSTLAALFLAYDTAPYATYPAQLGQAASLLSHVTKRLNIRPASILLGGDSAGANLALALIGHILHAHPNPTIPRIRPKEGEVLKGVLLISPWVHFSHSAPSFARNQYKDCISVATLNRWAKNYLCGARADPYNQPLTAPDGWWKDLNTLVKKVFIVGGSDEIMIDDILRLGEVLKKEWRGDRGAVEIVVTEEEAHVVVLIDRAIGYKPEDLEMDEEVKRWLKASL